MKFQYLVLVSSVLLVGSMVRAGLLWTTYTQCYECNGYAGQICPDWDLSNETRWGKGTYRVPTVSCPAAKGEYSWCRKDVKYVYDKERDATLPYVIRGCYKTDNYYMEEKCEKTDFESEVCYCHSNGCNK